MWRKYTPEVKAAKGLKRCQAKVRGVNNPAWIALYLYEFWLHTWESEMGAGGGGGVGGEQN